MSELTRLSEVWGITLDRGVGDRLASGNVSLPKYTGLLRSEFAIQSSWDPLYRSDMTPAGDRQASGSVAGGCFLLGETFIEIKKKNPQSHSETSFTYQQMKLMRFHIAFVLTMKLMRFRRISTD